LVQRKKQLDINQYIQSGILELYAAGAIPEAEAREVEAMAEKYPEVAAEIEAIQSSLVSYAGIYRKNPKPELRQKILENFDNGAEVYSQQIYRAPALFRYLMAAVWLFLALNIAGNIYFYTRLRDTESRLTAMNSKYEEVKNDMARKTNEFKMVLNRSNKIVDLKGMEMSPESFATVYWNPGTKQVMLSVEKLPMPPENMQYQLWALKDGRPVDAGVFGMESEMHMMPVKVMEADGFAVTLEKMGGSTEPSMERLYVMGKI
jgi:anti-sigma-K factor RskA